jgi:hypothetical protein
MVGGKPGKRNFWKPPLMHNEPFVGLIGSWNLDRDDCKYRSAILRAEAICREVMLWYSGPGQHCPMGRRLGFGQ